MLSMELKSCDQVLRTTARLTPRDPSVGAPCGHHELRAAFLADALANRMSASW